MPDARTVALVALRLAVAVAAMAGIGAIAHLPLGEASREGALRVALRTSLGQVEVCRDRTTEELEALPVHMRQPRVCEVRTIDYRLRVAVDGEPRLDRTVRHRGIRHNRPLVVDELLRVAPGVHEIDARFEPTGEPGAGAEELPRAVRRAEVGFAPGRIRLLTLDSDAVGWTLGD